MNAAPSRPAPELVESLVHRRCALFLGPDAGESTGGYQGLPTSWQLAEELAAICGHRGGYRPLPQIAQIYEHGLGRSNLVTYLRQRLDRPHDKSLPIHELISRIPFAVIVHAGWDRLLEACLDVHHMPYQVVRSAVDLPYTLPEHLLLYKPYGSFDQPSTLVITEDDQLGVFYALQSLKGRLADLMRSYSLLMVGYAPNFDSVFVRLYYEIRQEQGMHRRPTFVVAPANRPEDASQWEARGIRPVTADPAAYLYELAKAVAVAEGRAIALPDLSSISRAPRTSSDEAATQTRVFNQILEKLGVSELVEQSDIPLLSADQSRDIDAMRAAFERLAQTLPLPDDAAQVWLRQGNVEYVRQNYEQARQDYEHALLIRPDFAEAYYNLHYVCLVRGDFAGALAAYQQTIALKPELALLPARYQIDRVLGRGGIGIVYRALDKQSSQLVAVKLLDRAFLRNEKAVRRFRREAEILQRLTHAHIVRYIDFQLYKGRYFLVTEYLGEQTLDKVLAERQRLPLDEAHDFLQQIYAALRFAHQQRIIHRDVKPANIFLVDGQSKLIDFGLAIDLVAGQPSSSGQATGTVAYMAPEQINGGVVDERTDVYAVATLAYEMITGRHPGQGAYRPPAELVPGLNEALDLVLQKGREFQPERRYPSIDAFCQELAQVVPQQPISRQAPLWLHFLARFQQGLRVTNTKYWPLLLLLIALLGLAFPRPLANVGILLWDVLLLLVLADWFVTWLARRAGYPSLAANGPLLGFVLGLGVALVTLAASDPATDLRVGAGDQPYLNYLLALLIYGVFGVIAGVFSFLAMASGFSLAVRLRLNPRTRVWLGFGLAVLVIAVFGLVLEGQF